MALAIGGFLMLMLVTTILIGFSLFTYYYGRKRALSLVAGKSRNLHSRPFYYGLYTALWCGVPSLLLVCLWFFFDRMVLESMISGTLGDARPLIGEAINLAASGRYEHASQPIVAEAAQRYASLQDISRACLMVISLTVAMVTAMIAVRSITPRFRARNAVERAVNILLVGSSAVAVLTTIGIVLSLVFESVRFFAQVSPIEFLFGLDWSPQMAMRADQVGSTGAFGAVPLFAGTLLITLIAMVVAVPVGLFSAIYMAEYAHPKLRAVAKPLLELLAGIPTVVYGYFAVLTVAPLFRELGATLGLPIASECAMVAGIVMGVMIIPFISSISDDVITAVPDSLRQGAYGLGATKSETIKQVIIPAALPGIVSGVLLAVSRAIGETMIVVMAAGLSARLTANPFDAVTTITVQIVTLLVGDQEFDSPKTLSAFALGLTLFVVTLILNVAALKVVRKYQEKYD